MAANLTTQEIVRAHELMTRIRARDGGACCWHIVLEDFNLDDSSVDFCIGWAAAPERRHSECLEIGPLLKRMSKTQRKKLAHNGYARGAALAGVHFRTTLADTIQGYDTVLRQLLASSESTWRAIDGYDMQRDECEAAHVAVRAFLRSLGKEPPL